LDKEIKSDIGRIREVLESFQKEDFHSGSSFYHSSSFPRGCCGDSTNLLGLFLKEKYGQDALYVEAKGLGDNRDLSHAWLLIDGVIVDITGDQFNDIGYEVEPVVISDTSDFHDLFHNVKSYSLNAESLKGTAIASVLSKVRARL